jgi:CubicO group peptidase (beta-lactamase class C family)
MASSLPRTTPEAAGFAADLDDRLTLARECGVLPNVHGVIAARGGRVFCERYWPGVDFALGRPLGLIRPGPEAPHDLRSVSKSVTGLLYGIALDRALVPPPEAPLYDAFPEHADLAADPARRGITIHHALTMTLGLDWDESSLPYSDPANSEIAMERAPDRCRFVLERPVREAPGRRWIYCGGATALLARIIERGTGCPLGTFARDVLFEPLGFGAWEWMEGRDGVVMAASGLRLTLPDLLRLGLALQGHGPALVSPAWLDRSFSPQASAWEGQSYGYLWYAGTTPRDLGPGGVGEEPTISAMGNGGQRLYLLPGLDLAVGVFAGNYDHPDQWRPPAAVLRDVLLPALIRR